MSKVVSTKKGGSVMRKQAAVVKMLCVLGMFVCTTDSFAEELLAELPVRGNSLAVGLAPKPGCVFGDADAVQMEAAEALKFREAPERTEVLLSVETLFGDATPQSRADARAVAVRSITAGELDRTGTTHIPLSSFAAGKPWIGGVFLCLSGEAGSPHSCRTKPIASYADIFAAHKVEVNTVTNQATRISHRDVHDKLFYFRPLIWDGSKLLVLNRSLRPADYAELKAQLGKLKIDGEDLERLSARIQGYGELGSLPLKTGPSSVGLQLPFFQPAKCTAAAKS